MSWLFYNTNLTTQHVAGRCIRPTVVDLICICHGRTTGLHHTLHHFSLAQAWSRTKQCRGGRS
eukprot:3902393-Amphidinium_carterae.1